MDRSQTDTTGDPGKSGVRLRGQTGDGSQSDTETIKNHNQIEPIDAQIQTETTGDPHQIETGDGGRTEATGERDQTETGGRAGSSHGCKEGGASVSRSRTRPRPVAPPSSSAH
ncbi:hypothetical protein GN956_G16172 [Arapaima gigas]